MYASSLSFTLLLCELNRFLKLCGMKLRAEMRVNFAESSRSTGDSQWQQFQKVASMVKVNPLLLRNHNWNFPHVMQEMYLHHVQTLISKNLQPHVNFLLLYSLIQLPEHEHVVPFDCPSVASPEWCESPVEPVL